MAEYIEREALREVLVGLRDAYADVDDEDSCGLIEDVLGEVNAQPTADVAPVVHGEWIFGEIGPVGCTVKCSACGWGLNSVDPVLWVDYAGHNYCGSCGAKMDGGVNE